MIWALQCASIRCDFRMFPTRNKRYNSPFLKVTTAFFENIIWNKTKLWETDSKLEIELLVSNHGHSLFPLILITVCERCFGLASFANTIPAIQHEMTTPRILCMLIRITASGHSSVVWREPYLQKNWLTHELMLSIRMNVLNDNKTNTELIIT